MSPLTVKLASHSACPHPTDTLLTQRPLLDTKGPVETRDLFSPGDPKGPPRTKGQLWFACWFYHSRYDTTEFSRYGTGTEWELLRYKQEQSSLYVWALGQLSYVV